jgi:glycosyltransferase involved in cell wall biosynthesis
MDKNVVFFSHIYPEEYLDYFRKLSNGPLSAPAISYYEESFITLFARIFPNMFVINHPFIPEHPKKSSSIFVKSFEFTLKNGISGKSIDYINWWKTHIIFRYSSMKKTINRYARKLGAIDIAVVSTYHDSKLIRILKRKNPKCKILFLLPDIPHFRLEKNQSPLHRVLIKKNIHDFNKNLSQVDLFLPISKHMIDYLNFDHNKSFVVEGVCCSNRNNNLFSKKRGGNKTIAYLGSLSKEYGVLTLIKAFISSDLKEYKLVLAGKGHLHDEIKRISLDNPNIIFKGFISREESILLQKQADLLVVPELPSNSYSKYSFHSKIFEYMQSGTPVLTYKYGGIPSDYYDYLFFIEENGNPINDLAASLKKTLEYGNEYLLATGDLAADFIKKKKSVDAIAKLLLAKMRRLNL